MKVSRGEEVANYVILGAFSIVMLFPLMAVLLLALQPAGTSTSTMSLETLTFESFQRAWTSADFGTYLRNSAIVSASVVVIAATLSVLTGYAFGTMRFRGSKPLFFLFLLGLIMPYEAAVIPLYYALRSVGLTNTYWALILPQAALGLSFGTFWMRAYFRSLPPYLAEAAMLDGANRWAILWRVMLPNAKPAITTMVLLFFMWTWNEFLLALVMITRADLRTAPLGLAQFSGQFTSDLTALAAGSILTALPIVVIYLIFQRSFIQGVLSGGSRE